MFNKPLMPSLAKPLLWAVRVLTTNFKMEVNKIYNEDCLETLKRLPDNSVDLVI